MKTILAKNVAGLAPTSVMKSWPTIWVLVIFDKIGTSRISFASEQNFFDKVKFLQLKLCEN